MDKADEWAVERGETPSQTTPECTTEHYTDIYIYTHTHIHKFAQVLFLVLAPLQRRDKALEGEEWKKNTEQEGMERIRNDGKLEKRCFRGERDHKRQLRENNILQVMRHAHTSAHARTTQCSHL